MEAECKYRCPVCGGAMVWCGYSVDLEDETFGGVGTYCEHCQIACVGEEPPPSEAGPSGAMGIGGRTDLLH